MTTDHKENVRPVSPARMSRAEWLAFHVAQAPKISPEQWAKTVTLLRAGGLSDNRAA